MLCLFFVLFLGVADNQVVSPLLPAIRSQFSKSSYEMGFLFTGYSLSAGLSVLLWGPLSDIFGRRKGMLAGLILFAFGSGVSSVASNFYTLLAGRMVTGMAGSMLSLNTISFAADYFPYARRGRAMGSIFSSYFAALILGVPLGSLVGDTWGWNAVFGLIGGLCLLLLASTYWLLPHAPVLAGGAVLEQFFRKHARTYAGFLRTHETVGALLGSLLASAGMTGFIAFVGVWLHDAFHIAGRQVGLVFLAAGAAALVASPFAGALSDKIGKRRQFVLSSAALTSLLLVLPQLRWGIPIFVLFCAVSLASAFRQGPMEALITEVVPSVNRGSFVALKNSCSQVGIALSALISGLLFESKGYSGVCLFCAALNLAAAGSIGILVRRKNL